MGLTGFDFRALVGVILAGTWGLYAEQLPDAVPALRDAQLKSHQVLSRLNPRGSRVHWVSLVEIDDSSYYGEPFNGVSPLSRRALGDLVLQVGKAGALVIGLDIILLRSIADSGARTRLSPDSEYLRKALDSVAGSGVPIVLTTVLDTVVTHEFREAPNVFQPGDFRAEVYFGHINLPVDTRQIPLAMRADTWDGLTERSFESFAQQLVRAYETVTHMQSSAANDPRIQGALRTGDFVYGGFISAEEFDRTAASAILQRRTGADRCCHGRIVVIGGTWRVHGGRGSQIESFASPVGTIPGLYLHANYVEALNDGRLWGGVPRWLAVTIDLGAAVLIYLAFHRSDTFLRRSVFLALLLVVLLSPYAFATNMGLYVDFTAGLLLCFVHLFVEHVHLGSQGTRAGRHAKR